MTVAETVKEITRKHLTENNGVVMGQCLSAVGWVGGTVPEMPGHPNLIELSMDDTCSSGLAAGYALAGRRPIFICRYQGFMHFNQVFFTNFAAKAKEMWGYGVPIFIRAVAMEGGIGPVAGSSHHGMIIRMPGIRIVAPMTSGEYTEAWKDFMEHDAPLYVSEHRHSFSIDHEMTDLIHRQADITLFPISAARLNTLEAVKLLEKEGIICNVINLLWLKPLIAEDKMLNALENSRFGGMVVDTDYENGASKCIACDLMQKTDKKVGVMGLEERTAGFAPHLDNLPPSSEKIAKRIKEKINRC